MESSVACACIVTSFAHLFPTNPLKLENLIVFRHPDYSEEHISATKNRKLGDAFMKLFDVFRDPAYRTTLKDRSITTKPIPLHPALDILCSHEPANNAELLDLCYR